MFREIVSFEVKRQIRQPLPWVFFAVFFLMAFGDRASENIQLLGDTSSLLRNAPFLVVEILVFMTIMGTLVAASVVATSVQRDYALNTYPLLFAMPMPKRAFLLGRFFGSLVVGVLVMGGAALGVLAGAQGPWHDPSRVGPFTLAPYVKSVVVFVLPNLFVTGSLLFAVATLTRSLRTTYAAVVFLLMSYGTAGALLTGGFSTDLSYKSVAALADPFAFSTFRVATRYWTPAERNTLDMPLAGVLLANRLLWLGVGALALGWTVARFRPEEPARPGRAAAAPPPQEGERAAPAGPLPTPVCTFSAATSLTQYLHQTRLEVGDILRSLPFHVMLLIGCANLVLQSFAIDQLYGTPIHPLTTVFLRVILFSFPLWVFIITTFFSGELAWRERSVRLDPVYDALPVADAVPFAAKTTALVLLQVVMLLAATLVLMATQAARGYYHFEPLLYFKGFFLIVLLGFAVCAVMAMALQVLAGNKYLAFLLMVLCFISSIALPSLGFEHDLLQLPFRFEFPHSDLNGFGHFVKPVFWLGLHWALFAAVLGLLAVLFWMRGAEGGVKRRLREARRRLTATRLAALAGGVLALGGTDAWVLYNTTVLNEYLNAEEREARRADYEKKYRSSMAGLALPRIAEVHTEVDIFPAERVVRLRGRYVLENRSGSPIRQVPLTLPRRLEVAQMTLAGARLTGTDRTQGVYTYELDPPLLPGARAALDFDVSRVERGFKNGIQIADLELVYNGSFLRGLDFLPHIGYRSSFELTDGVTRRRYGLPETRAWPEPEDPASRQVGYFGPEADWVRMDTVVSTSPDQVAIAPGTLAREWREGERRYFRYEMEQPVAGGGAFLSGRFDLARDRWKDVDIEVFYHPTHRFNVEGMIRAVKRSLEVFSESLGPYPHRLVRIVEFPRYEMSAESYPTTIPFSESAGFIARVDATSDVDPLFHVTAHEMAHQWWGNAVVPARAKGGEFLVESLAEYSATEALRKEYGPGMVRRLMRYEREEYLSKRGTAANPEVPLSRVEGQHYIRYNKGALALEALRAYLGEQTMNQVLGEFARATMYQGPPYPVADDLLVRFKQAAPERYRSLVDDLFNRITLWDNKAVAATWEPAEEGQARVTLTVEAHKRRTDEKGQDSEIPMDDWVEVALFGKDGSGGGATEVELYREKHAIESGRQTLSMVVKGQPKRAAIDPDGLLIDRNSDDNEVPVERR